MFLWPVPGDLSPYYRGDYYGVPASVDRVAASADPERYKVQLVQQFKRTGRLLEIGPSWGGFAFLAREAGFEVEVIERDAKCCQFLRDVIKVGVHEGDDPATMLDVLPRYDVIALWQVIEHLADPWATLEAMADHLAPGGILVIATPNPRAFQFRLFGRRWTHLDAPRHIELIPIELLREWGTSRSLRTLLATTRDVGSLGWNSFGWQESIGALFGGRVGRKAGRTVGQALSLLMSRVDGREGFGCAYTIVLEKPA